MKSKLILLILIVISTFVSIHSSEAQDSRSFFVVQQSQNILSPVPYLTSASKSTWEPDSDFKICEKGNINNCDIDSKNRNQGVNAYFLLPKCENYKSDWCIDSVEILINKNTVPLNFIKYSTEDQIQPVKQLNLPFGKSASLWINPLTNENYVVNIGASAVYSPYWDTQFRFSDFGASIRKVKVTSFYISEKDLTHKVEENIFGEKKFSPSLTYPTICEWASVGECGTNLELNKDEKISLKIRIGKEIGGWIDGRLGNPAVATKSINSSQYEFKIEANPVSVPNYEGKIAIDQLPNQIVENNPINLMPGGMGVLANSPNFEVFNLWTKLVSDKSIGESTLWNFNMVTKSNNVKCLNKTQQFLGIVTTNSTIYQGSAPEFKNNSLVYQVGSPHYSSDGKVQQGYYFMNLRKDVASCLYGFKKTPARAKVQIQNIDGSSYITTSTLKESPGWLNLRVAGFTFSTPKISVSFPKN